MFSRTIPYAALARVRHARSCLLVPPALLAALCFAGCGDTPGSTAGPLAGEAGDPTFTPSAAETCEQLEDDPKAAATILREDDVGGYWENIIGDEQDLYWSTKDLSKAQLIRAPRQGGQPQSLGTWYEISELQQDAESVFARTDDGVLRVSKADNETKELAQLPDVGLASGTLAVDDKFVYTVGSPTFDADCTEGKGVVYAIDKGTGETNTLASGQHCPEEVHVQGAYLYFFERGIERSAQGSSTNVALKRVNREGGELQVLARGWFQDFAVQDESAYVAVKTYDAFGGGEMIARVPVSGGPLEPVSDRCQFVGNMAATSDGVIYGSDRYAFVRIARDNSQLFGISLTSTFGSVSSYRVLGDEILLLDPSRNRIWSIQR